MVCTCEEAVVPVLHLQPSIYASVSSLVDTDGVWALRLSMARVRLASPSYQSQKPCCLIPLATVICGYTQQVRWHFGVGRSPVMGPALVSDKSIAEVRVW